MEFVFNPRFEETERCSSFSLSDKHRTRLAVLLLGWESSLPTIIRHHIAKVQVRLENVGHREIVITVHLEGEYTMRTGHLADESRVWKSSLRYSLPYQHLYNASSQYEPSFCRHVPQELTSLLQVVLKGEISALEQPKKLFTSMLGSLTAEVSAVPA